MPKNISLFLAFVVAALFLLSGCISTIGNFGCSFVSGKDADHCYQFVAREAGDESICQKIKGEDFAKIGSNPPKDKCFLQVANKTNNVSICDKIEGGFMSYSREECIANVAENTGDPALCNLIKYDTGYDGKSACILRARQSPNYSPNKEKTALKQEEGSSTEAKNGSSTPTSKPKASSSTAVSSTAKNATKSGIAIKAPPTTESEKSAAILQSGTKPADPSKIDSKTGQILLNLPKPAKKDIASATSQKESAIQSTPLIPQPSDKDKEQPEGFLSKAWNWITWGGGKTADVYEAGGEKAPTGAGALKTGGDITEAITDAGEISDSFDKVNNKVSSGEITSSQGKLLKVGYGLGKAIKWVAKKVPIVGDTVGSAADESFKAGMKAGEKIAIHTTKTNKCIEDPLSDDCID